MTIEVRQETLNRKVDVTRRKAISLLSVGVAAAVLAACKSTSGSAAKEDKRNEGGY